MPAAHIDWHENPLMRIPLKLLMNCQRVPGYICPFREFSWIMEVIWNVPNGSKYTE